MRQSHAMGHPPFPVAAGFPIPRMPPRHAYLPALLDAAYGTARPGGDDRPTTIEAMAPEDTDRERRHHDRRRWSRRAADIRQPFRSRVLVIEPHDDTRMLYTTILEDAGYVVYAVANGTDALTVASQRLPDLVITETSVPRLDGFALLSLLRESTNTADIPVVVVTGMVHDNVPQRARDAGAAVVLPKPTSLDVPIHAIDDVLRNTPPGQLMRRHLRRTLVAIRKVATQATVDADAQRRVRALIDRLQVAVLAVDDRGNPVAVSRGAASLTGYSRAELLTMSIYDLVCATDLPSLRSSAATDVIHVEVPPLAMREKIGTTLLVDALVTTVLPGLYAAAFTPVERIHGPASD
jgi:PAS domain S-box-containing protein